MTDEHEHDEAEQSTPADSSIPAEQEDRIVDKVVEKVRGWVEQVTGPGGAPAESESGEGTATAPLGSAATEADMEHKVKAAVEKEITAKERRSAAADARAAHDAEHEKLRAAIERPPRTHSRLTTALWGADDS
jgi:hypothetical protein